MVPSNAKLRVKSGSAQVSTRGQQRRVPWIILLSLSTVATVAGAAVLAGLSPAFFLGRSSITVTDSASESVPTGTIAESDREYCKRLRFDDNGRVFQDVVPCDGEGARDAHGQPAPAGTMRRLDAISKSFSGH